MNNIKKHAINPNNVLALLCLLGTTMLFQLPGLFGPFWLDDMLLIAPTRMDEFRLHALWTTLTDQNNGVFGQPLTLLSLSLNHLMIGHTPFDFKIVNLTLHLCNGILILFILEKLFCHISSNTSRSWAAYCITFLWLIHPLQVSTIQLPAARATLLSTFFVLLGILCYLLARSCEKTQRKRCYQFTLCSIVICYPLAILSHVAILMYPLLLVCIDRMLLSASHKNNVFPPFLKLCLIWLSALAMMTCLGLGLFNGVVFDGSSIAAKIHAQVYYLQQSLIPQTALMGIYHDEANNHSLFSFNALLETCILLSFLGVMIATYKKYPLLCFGLAWYTILHLSAALCSPSINIVEQHHYLALLGLMVAGYQICLNIFSLTKHRSTKTLLWSSLVLLSFAFAALTFSRSLTWSSEERFLYHSYKNHPNSVKTHIEMANWLLNSRSYFFALRELEKAQQLDPFNLGIKLHKLLIYCHAEQAPAHLYNDINSAIPRARLDRYTFMLLDTIVNNFNLQQCSGINIQKFSSIIENMLNASAAFLHPEYEAMLLHFDANLKLIINNQKQNDTFILQSSISPESPPNRGTL